MIVEAAGDVVQWGDDPSDLRCFFCGNRLHMPGLVWSGATSRIYLDERCWPELFVRLAVDAHILRRRHRAQGAA